MFVSPRFVGLLVALFALYAGRDVRCQEKTSAEGAAFFEQRIRPILVSRCQSCHGAKKQEYDLRLDSRAGLLTGSDDGKVVVVGKPDESKLIQAIRYGGDFKMPPKGKLPDEEIAALTRWVELGLPWPQDEAGPAQPLRGEALYRHARANLWSLQPIERRRLPAVKDRSWPRRPIDLFVLAKLEAAGLRPAPEADRRTLIRRATFDLLGLPPTPEEVEAFLANDSPDAYERLIDRLLASPAYGERWGRHWLDVARYADTKGYAFGRERKFPFAYTYRDWVIRSLNADMPYDEFVVQQLAADRLPDNPVQQQAALGFLTVGRKYNNQHDDIDDQIDAVTRGFLGLTVACARCHDHKYDAIPTEDYYSLYGVFASSTAPKEYPLIGSLEESAGYQKYKSELDKRQKTFEDFKRAKHAELLEAGRQNVTEYLVRVVTKKPEELLSKLPFLSLNPNELKPGLLTRWRQHLTKNAREDHPVWKALVLRGVKDEEFAHRAARRMEGWRELPADKFNPLVKQALLDRPPTSKAELARVYGDVLLRSYVAWRREGANDAAREKLPPPQRQLLDELLGDGTPTNVPIGELKGYLIRADRNHYTKLEKDVHSHMANSPGAPPRAMSLVDRPQPFNPQVFIRGNHHRRGERVPRQFLRVVAGEQRTPFNGGSGRLELGRAIVDPANPLTARVIVNRVWMHHFGRPLVATPSDFGTRSSPPVHLDVLDYLASQLISPLLAKEGSGEVRSSGATPPSPPLEKGGNDGSRSANGENGWSLKALHREIMLSSTYRQASTIPQSAIRIPQSKDPENTLLWRMNRRRLEFEPLRDSLLAVSGNLDRAMGGRPVELFTNMSLRRRSVYGFIDRQDLPNLLRAFDFASPDQSAASRPATTVPQQSLFLMNSPFLIQQSKALVARSEIQSESDARQRIAALYRLLFQRSPSEVEANTGAEFIAAAEANTTAADKLSPWEQYAQLLMLTNEFAFVD